MENFTIILALLSAIAFAAISKTLRRRRRLPPGPKPWPVIGNINLMNTSTRHRSLHSLSQKYGGIMQLTLGNTPVVVASSPEIAEQFLKLHDANFASRPPRAAGKYISYNYSNLLWAPYGPHWKQGRKIYLTEVFSARKLEFLQPIRAEETRSFLSRLCSLSGERVELREHFSRFLLSIMSRIVLGDECFAEMKGNGNPNFNLEDLQRLVREWMELNGCVHLGDWMTWLGFLDLQGNVKKMKELGEKFDRYFNYVIEYHLRMAAREDEIGRKDVADSVLELQDDVTLTRDCVKGLLQDLIVGGTDTVAGVMEWTIHEVMRHPRVIEKAKQELDNVIGRNRWAEESDLPQLPYINAIILEAMRLHPLAPLLVPHYAIDDCQVAGYDIAKGTVVIINVHSLGRDPNSWDAPDEFVPERFMGKDVDLTGGNFTLLPFGSGRRSCPGYKLGLKIARTTVSNLLHGYDLKLIEGTRSEDICMDEVYGIIQNPKYPLPIVMEPTLPPHLYSGTDPGLYHGGLQYSNNNKSV